MGITLKFSRCYTVHNAKTVKKETQTMSPAIYLHEEVLLLALNDDKGTINGKAMFFEQVMAGALLSELLLGEHIKLGGSDKKQVKSAPYPPTENDLLKEAYKLIKSSDKPKDLKHWFSKFSRITDLKKRTAYGLCKKGVLEAVEVKKLWLFSQTNFPEKNTTIEDALIQRLEDAIFKDHSEVDLRTATLIALLKGSSILTIPFCSKKLKKREKRIEQIANGDLVGGATTEMIQQIQAAILITTIMPAIMAPIITGR